LLQLLLHSQEEASHIKFPRSFFRDNRLGSLILVQNLQGNNEDPYGTFMPHSNHNLGYILLSVDDPPSYSEYTTGVVFQHELFHFLDGRDSGFSNEERQAWVALHPTGAAAFTKESTEPIDAFASPNGSVEPIEDMAELAAKLLDPDYHNSFLEYYTPDRPSSQIMLPKIEIIKSVYFKMSSGKMDEQYWQDLLAGRINEDYWPNRETNGSSN